MHGPHYVETKVGAGAQPLPAGGLFLVLLDGGHAAAPTPGPYLEMEGR